MGPLDTLNHLLNFLAPAAAMAVLMALGARLLGWKSTAFRATWAQVAIQFAVGSAVLLGGLVLQGRDGKMATYAALVLACATCQWAMGKSWKG
ncbi:hypothetical protein PMI14_02667 [Acidovorax sp. CF316]|uniref:hypothetical protein n=1 Tax=Acidovorax sp. CF316 TaxID=1144317 RepID=UPI00026BCF69|nr:hypothetical protein [Acidovorax sp. CF316]EJE52668.1 hypothetical protein PMI14_02667 [Acidovorax sp. CF316]